MTRAGLTPIVEQLLNDGADPDGLGDEGETSLYAAALLGDMELVKLLLAKGAIARRGGKSWLSWYKSPLAAAAHNGHLHIVKSLIAADEGRLGHKEDRYYLGGALYSAAEQGHRDCALLYSYGIYGTAAHAAIFCGLFELIPHFIEYDASVVGIRFDDGSLLGLAVGRESLVTSKLLLEAGADVEGLHDSVSDQSFLYLSHS